MLKPEYFENKEDQMLEMFRELENFLLNDISQRLLKAGEMSGTADRNLWKARQLGLQRDEILKKLSSMTGKTTRELKELLQDAVLTSWKDDKEVLEKMGLQPQNPLENPAFMEVINAQLKKSKGELSNLTRTTMKQAQKDLITLLNEADMRVASGMQSYSSAVCQILDEYAGRGIQVEYAKRSISLEAAVRMCVVTSMNQTTAQLTNAYIEEAQAEYVLVSAHAGARYDPKHPDDYRSHDHWQGRAYKINGSEEGYPNLLKSTGYDIRDGVGIVVKPEGLHGYNCRHSHQPWAKGLKNPYMDENGKLKIDTEESRKLYDMKQNQRVMERAIRKTKRQLLEKQTQIDIVAEVDYRPLLQAEYDKLAYKLRQQNKAYNDFCEDNDLAKASDRLKVSGFKKKQASAANGRATAYSNEKKKEVTLDNRKNNSIILSGGVSGARNPFGEKAKEHAKKYYGLVRSMKTDVEKIAKATGIPENDIQDIKNFIFLDKHDLGGEEPEYFTPDYMMAQSWQRLIDGKYEKHDITLLKHEMMERKLMSEGISQEKAHIMTSQKYDYSKEAAEYYAKIEKYRKE